MTTLNDHAQESESRLTSGKNTISVHYESTEVKQTVAARPQGGGGENYPDGDNFLTEFCSKISARILAEFARIQT